MFLLLGLENRNLLWYCDFLGKWEKLVKNGKCIVFPKSQYVILNPAWDAKESSLTKYYCLRSKLTMFPFKGVVDSKYNFSLL